MNNLLTLLVFLCLLAGFLPSVSQATTTIEIAPGADFHSRLQEALVLAEPGTIVLLPEGTYELEDEIIIDQSHITLKGRGLDKTVLNFKQQKTGAQGVLATADAFTIEDLAVLNTPGDGIKVAGAKGVIFRRVRVEWDDFENTNNGGYGLYPVQCSNVLVEDSIVRRASDAGVYVGQSHHIIVRRNLVQENVAGIEIENSRYADVYENVTNDNTAGILVFDLPNLKVQGGKQIRVFNNRVMDNNGKNFAAKGNIVAMVPPGTGIMVTANDDVEIFNNTIQGHDLVSVGVINYHMSQRPIRDPNYDPKPERIYIHDNLMDKERRSKIRFDQMSLIINLLFWFKIPQIVYDGIDDGTYSGEPLPQDKKICLQNNKNSHGEMASFGNMHMDHQRRLNPIPGGPVTRDSAPHDCRHEALPAIVLEDFPPPPAATPRPSPEEVDRLCNSDGEEVNFAAHTVDCPTLQSYRLFKDPTDPTAGPNGRGKHYDLTTPLFTDYAHKDRFVFLPDGTSALYDPLEAFKFPVGTIIAKSFWFHDDERNPEAGRHLIETRLLIKRATGWQTLPYIWDRQGQVARLSLGGGKRSVSYRNSHGKNKSFPYFVPSYNKCTVCHRGADGPGSPVGPKAKWLNRDDRDGGNQLKNWHQLNLLTGLPGAAEDIPTTPVWGDDDAELTARAKAYLDINCAHCHNPTGKAKMTGLFLEYERDWKETAFGNCKPPVAAGLGSGGREYALVPGKPQDSILAFRLETTNPSAMMPELGRTLIHSDSNALIKKWIKSLPTKDCSK
jgi:parallel beta-helix repeat protein